MKKKLSAFLARHLEKGAKKNAAKEKVFLGSQPLPKELKRPKQ
ncbi:hypothetical protein [Paenibacillus larvae]|nr:hypothetical protein [Paenibacillus larvae]